MEQKKDHKAWRLYLKLNNAKSEANKLKAREKIREYFFEKRRKSEGNENK